MTTKRLTNRRSTLNKRAEDVIADIIEGLSGADIARKYGVSRAGVLYFERRFAATILQAKAEVGRQVEDYAIASKINRIAAKDRRWQLLEAVRQARAHGGTGEETGLMVKQIRRIGSGEDAEYITEFKVDDGLISAMERLERSAAEELGQLPKQGDQYVFVGDKQQINLFDHSQAAALARSLLGVSDGEDGGTAGRNGTDPQ